VDGIVGVRRVFVDSVESNNYAGIAGEHDVTVHFNSGHRRSRQQRR